VYGEQFVGSASDEKRDTFGRKSKTALNKNNDIAF
jgi:hypothetical protein